MKFWKYVCLLWLNANWLMTVVTNNVRICFKLLLYSLICPCMYTLYIKYTYRKCKQLSFNKYLTLHIKYHMYEDIYLYGQTRVLKFVRRLQSWLWNIFSVITTDRSIWHDGAHESHLYGYIIVKLMFFVLI